MEAGGSGKSNEVRILLVMRCIALVMIAVASSSRTALSKQYLHYTTICTVSISEYESDT